jgi:putative hydrolase of the HAD superfamily
VARAEIPKLPHILSGFQDLGRNSVDIGFRKPELLGYLKLADALRVSPSNMVYVGNERKDIEGAVAAGMTAVLLCRGGEIPAWGQAATISQLTELAF